MIRMLNKHEINKSSIKQKMNFNIIKIKQKKHYKHTHAFLLRVLAVNFLQLKYSLFIFLYLKLSKIF